jgi:hypothetical protein
MPFSNGSFGRVYSAGMSNVRTLILAALLLAATGPLAESRAQGGCFSPSEGHQLVAEGQAITFPEAASRAGIEGNQVVDVQLCRSGGGYIYRVRLRDGGQANIPAN